MLRRLRELLRIGDLPIVATGKVMDFGTTVPTDASKGYETGCLFLHIDGSTGTALYINEGSRTSCAFNAVGSDARTVVTTPPTSYTSPALGVGVYGTPVVDGSLLDNIAFTANMSIAVDKTSSDTSSMAGFVGIANTADTPNTKLQGLLVSNSVGFDVFDAYAVQGHLTVAAAGMSTANANAHLTGLSGKAKLSGDVGQGWVSGVLAIVEGDGGVTGLCHVIAAQVEATCTDSVVDAILYLGADAVATAAIEFNGTANMTNIMKFDAVAGAVVANALVPAAAPTAETVGADAALKVDIGGTAYYIPLYNTLHGA